SHPAGNEPVSGFTATIDWGDGTSSAGTIVKEPQDNTSYSVLGSHTYTDERTYSISVVIQDDTNTVTANNTATILEELLPSGQRGTPSDRFVSEVYRDLLGRAVDQNGLDTWVPQYNALLAQGTPVHVAQGTIVVRIETDPQLEYATHVVEGFYEKYLGRTIAPSDGDSPKNFAKLIVTSVANYQQKADYATMQVRTIFLASPEYFSKRAGGSNATFVDALYHDALGRSSAGDPGAAAMVAALDNGSATRDEAA